MGKEINLLKNYPKAKRDLSARLEQKTQEDRGIARKFGQEFFDGERKHGYGGFEYNPRFWQPVIPTFREYWNLSSRSKVLDIGCGKGFMMHDLYESIPGIDVRGIDISSYAISNCIDTVKDKVLVADAKELPFDDNSFDVVISINKNRIYENFEHSVALKIGLGKALDKLNIKKVAKDIRNKSIILRRKLRNFKNIIFFENIERISGINTFCIDGIKTDHVYNYLMSKKILCSLSTLETSSLYFSKKKTNKLLRISLHEYNTIKEINYLVKCLIDLTKK